MKKIVFLLISSMMIISCGSGGGGSTPTGPTPTVDTVSFSPTTPTAGSNYVKMEQVSVSGDTVIIAVKAVSITEPVGGLAVDVTYDTSKLSFISTTNGDVINGNASYKETDNGGAVVMTISDVVDASPSANGTLFTITFKGTATGSGSVVLQNNSLFNASGNSINGVSWYGGTVTVE